MIKWEISHEEVQQIKNLLAAEKARNEDIAAKSTDEGRKKRADIRQNEYRRLLRSLEKASEEKFDITCYCDSNYDYYAQTLSVSFRIGDAPVEHRVFPDMAPPPDEYLGIMAVLEELSTRQIKGHVVVITDASRCALALQQAMKYHIPNHTENQAPRKWDFNRPTALAALEMTKGLLPLGCKVEFRFRHRTFINDALNLR